MTFGGPSACAADPRWLRRAQLAVVASALLAYGAALLGTFVYDDVHAVRDNPAIRSLANLPLFFVDVDLFSTKCRMYRPVILATYALDWAVGRGAALPFKITNLLLHAGVALALFRLLLGLCGAPRVVLLASCLFAVHPLASEAVNTVSGRSELGVTLALLLALHAHRRAASAPAWSLGTAACALLACGCKEIGVVLPALLLALDPPRRSDRRGWFAFAGRHLPPLLAVLGYLVVRRVLFGQATTAVPSWSGGSDPMVGYGRDLTTQLATMATLLPRALAQCLVPLGLTLDPPVTYVRSCWTPAAAGGALLVAAATAIGLRGAASDPARRLGMVLAWTTALPWIVVPLNLPYLEHRMYAPLAGLAAVLAAAVGKAALRPVPPAVRRGRAVLATAVLLAFPVLAGRRSLEYRDPLTLWQGVVAAQPASVRGLCSVAVCHLEKGELAAALPLVQRALALWPANIPALSTLVELHLALAPAPGNVMTALTTADRLVELAPNDPLYRVLRSRALAAAAAATDHAPWYDAAETEALHCLTLAPPKSLVYRTAAAARTRQGEHGRALALLDEAIAAGLVNAAVLLDRVDCLRALGRHAEADALVQRVLRDYPFDPAVLELLDQRAAAAPPVTGRGS